MTRPTTRSAVLNEAARRLAAAGIAEPRRESRLLAEHALAEGVPAERITELDWWQSHHLLGLTVHCTPAQHFSGRGPHDRNATLWASFVLEGADPDDASGFSVSSAGDVNGDGFADLIVGAFLANPNGNGDAGESYVVFGASGGFPASLDLSSLDGANGFTINGIDQLSVQHDNVMLEACNTSFQVHFQVSPENFA